MLRNAPRAVMHGEISPIAPLLATAAGLLLAILVHWWLGAGLAAGAALAYANSGLLIKRIHFATLTSDTGAAMVSMHVGLLVTFTLAAAATILLLQLSLALTVTMAIAFFAMQTVILVLYYLTARQRAATTSGVTASEGMPR